MTEDIKKKRKRLIYRANYRGFKEADLLIGGFAKAHVAEMSEAELDAFDVLLEVNDRELYAYATGKAAVPPALDGPVMAKLKNFELPGL